MTTPTVCVYGVFRDEEAHVARWAETTGDADRRFVLDTGSVDATVAELALHGIPTAQAEIRPFRFDDARNVALYLAPPADLYLMLDADEVLCDDWRERVVAAYHPTVGRYRYTLMNGAVGEAGTWLSTPRANLHRRYGYRWTWPVHECLEGHGPESAVPGMFVIHHPDLTKPRADYLDMLRAVTRDHPHSGRMAFYYGRELWYRGMLAACREELARFLALDGWPPERGEAWRILGHIDTWPERWYVRAVGECPERREPWCDLARLYAREGRHDEARAALAMAAARVDQDIYQTDADCWGEGFERLTQEITAEAGAHAGLVA